MLAVKIKFVHYGVIIIKDTSCHICDDSTDRQRILPHSDWYINVKDELERMLYEEDRLM